MAWRRPRSRPAGAAALANGATLALTLGFSVVAMALLAQRAPLLPGRWAAAALVYGVMLEASALCSFLYNLLQRQWGPWRATWRYLDHSAIFLLIAGTYTPLATIALPQPFGRHLMMAVWCLAGVGIVLKLFLRETYDRLFVGFYLAMGLSVLVGFNELLRTLDPPTMSLVLGGGLAYIVGAIAYVRDDGCWTEAVWHTLVLVGAVSHFTAIYVLLAPS